MAAVNKLKFWAPPIAWMGVIFWLSSVRGSDLPEVDIPFADKLVHCGEYLILGLLVARAFLRSFPGGGFAGAFIGSVAISALYAAFDELHQAFTPGRTADIFDFAANFIGLIIGALSYLFMKGRDNCHR